MSAYLELQHNGRLGPDGAAMLYRATATAARRGRFRPAAGRTWDRDAVHEAAAGALAKGGSKMLSSLLIRATDDESLERLLVAAVTNHMRDRDRRENHGPLIRSLTDAANDEANELTAVETSAGRAWTLPGVGHEAWAGDRSELVAAAYTVTDVALLRWRSETRRSPVAERASLVAVMSAVIGAAGSPVTYTTMAEVIENRFALMPPPLLVDLDHDPGPVDPDATPEELASASEDAIALFDQLTDRERLTLHLYEEGTTTVRDLADLLGVGKSTAANTVNRLKQVLGGALASHPDPETVLMALGDLIDAWTARSGPSSGTGDPS